MSGLFGGGGGGGFKMPTSRAGQSKTTAAPVAGQQALTPAEKKSRRLAASIMTKSWGQPPLSGASLLGI